ncbi:MAG: C1 family peptidase [Chitinophagaceae bacterium]
MPKPTLQSLELKASLTVKQKLVNLKSYIVNKNYDFKVELNEISLIDLKKITSNNNARGLGIDFASYQNELAEKILKGVNLKAIPSATIVPGTDLVIQCRLDSYIVPNLPPIRNQGDCGSCWAFAVAGITEINLKNRFNWDVDLSEQNLIDCATPFADGCNGFFSELPLIHTQNSGIGKEEVYSYKAIDQNKCFTAQGMRYKLKAWGYAGIPIQPFVPNSVTEIKNAIRAHGAVATSVAATECFQNYKEGIFNEIPPSSAYDLNHAVIIVGWDDCKQAWRVRNSWGRSWGEEGYIWIKYGYNGIGSHTTWVEAENPDPAAQPPNVFGNSADIEQGTYYIKCASGGKYLDVQGNCVNNNGCNVILNRIDETPDNNKFMVLKVKGPLGGYTLRCISGDKFLDGNSSPVDPPSNPLDITFDLTPKLFVNGCLMQVWERTDPLFPRTNQEWSIEKLPNGRYIIKNILSGKVIDAVNADVNKDGGKVQLYSRVLNDDTQEWIFEKVN